MFINQIGTPKYHIMPEFNLLVCGDSSVGKTSYINRHTTGEFDDRDKIDYPPIKFYTSTTEVTFHITVTSDIYLLPHLSKIDAVIIMFDVVFRDTFLRIYKWYEKCREVYGNKIPIIIVGNKVDRVDRRVKPKMISFFLRSLLDNKEIFTRYYDLSAKCYFNFEKPFLEIARYLMNDSELHFVEPK